MYADIATMSGKLGMKTRCVISLSGKVAPRPFKTSLIIFEFLFENINAFGAWLQGLFGLGAGRRILRAVRQRPYASHGHATFDQTSNRQDVPRERR